MTAAIYATNQPPCSWDQAKDIMESGSGVFRTQKLASDLFSLIAECGRLTGRTFDKFHDISAVLANGALGVIMPFAVSSSIEAGQTVHSLMKKNFSCTLLEGLDVVQKMALSAQMVAYSAMLFTQNAAYGLVGDIYSMVEDGAEVFMVGNQLQDLSAVPKAALSKEAKVYLDESKKLHCIKLAKAVLAVAVSVLGLIPLMYGAPLAPAIFLLAMSVMSSALALWGTVYKTNMTYVLPISRNAG